MRVAERRAPLHHITSSDHGICVDFAGAGKSPGPKAWTGVLGEFPRYTAWEVDAKNHPLVSISLRRSISSNSKNALN